MVNTCVHPRSNSAYIHAACCLLRSSALLSVFDSSTPPIFQIQSNTFQKKFIIELNIIKCVYVYMSC